MWVGGGKETGLGSDTETFLRTVGKRVQYTAARLGVDPLSQFHDKYCTTHRLSPRRLTEDALLTEAKGS
jgi:hypothetical protein